MAMMVAGALVAAGCLPDPLPVDELPMLQPKITVASQIVPEEGLIVFLTRSVGALDASEDTDPQTLLNQIVINDALVTLHYAGQTDTLLAQGSGLYGTLTDIAWQAGTVYELRVTSPAWGEVNAFANVQPQVPFQSVQARLFVTEFDSLAEVSYSLQDPQGANYYMINVQKVTSDQGLNSLLNPDVFTYLITDRDFEGRLFQDQFRVFFRDFSPGDTVSVFLANIQKEYYDFLKLRNDNQYNFAEFASEPINYPTNVNGGLGFFNLHVPDVRIFALEQ